MDSIKFIIILFFVISFLFSVASIIFIALLQKNNKRITERSGVDRRAVQRRAEERRKSGRECSGRRNSDRRGVDRRVREGSIFDRENFLGTLSPSLS
ncbi:MAG: hypothetical protein JW864_03245 [Spirochaetes bacterium]|nr:hypothetical protein [Spirochaetota bacterium]